MPTRSVEESIPTQSVGTSSGDAAESLATGGGLPTPATRPLFNQPVASTRSLGHDRLSLILTFDRSFRVSL
jgi:hypothetical protein